MSPLVTWLPDIRAIVIEVHASKSTIFVVLVFHIDLHWKHEF